MKKILYIIAASLFVFGSCDKIDESERFVENPQPPKTSQTVVKRMLIEDFTGQNCPNCPDGAELLENLQKSTYTNGEMIVVSMHAGGLANPNMLKNETAQSYMDALNLLYNPALSVDRVSSTDAGIALWTGMITSRASVSTPCDIKTYVYYDESKRLVNVVSEVNFVSDFSNGKLGVQHYLLRDSIVAPQSFPVIGYVFDYVHNHVFFGTLYNNIWGEELVGESDGSYRSGSSYMSKASDDFVLGNEKWGTKEPWDPAKVSIVSFVFKYTDDNEIGEVLQANKVKLLN